MYLKALEIQGFKSFPDKTVLNFGEDITAIVGPNGSGKSNISDAIRWVMGEQNSRQLRGAKMEDVIFGGTEKRNQMGFAQVTLVIDNTEHIFPTREEAEVAVTRRYYRSGESEYYINKQSVRLKDVNELFMDTGMGREGYSIIGQGKIDEILSVKSGERREIFEEAAGISKYRHRKEESERKLERTEENLVRINDKIAELELQVEPLRAQAETAKKYLVLRDELRVLEISVWLEQLQNLRTAKLKLESDTAQAKEACDQAQAALDEAYAQGERFTEEMRQNDVAADALRGQVTEAESAAGEESAAIAVLQTSVEHNNESLRRLEQELTSTDQRRENLQGQIDGQLARIADIDRDAAVLETALSELLSRAQALADSAKGAADEAEALRAQEAIAVAEAADGRAALSALQAGLDEAGQRRITVRQELSEAQRKLEESEKDAKTNRRALDDAREEAQAAENIIQGHSLRMDSRRQKAQSTQDIKQELTRQVNAQEDRIRLLTEMEKEYEGFNKAVKTVMQAAEQITLRGLHGPVAGLMTTEQTYAVALETALGAALQNIVVEREEDAKAAIQFLKQRDGGRATFLPLTAIRGDELRENAAGEYGFVGIASRLVRYDARYDHIFKNLLGRTVVVEDLDSGIAMARKFRNAFRIVTLDGQIINRGGSMTGGSASRSSGVLSRANELERLKAAQGALHGKLNEAAQQAEAAQRELQKAEYELQVAKDQQRKAADEVLTLQGRQDHYDLLLESLRLSCETMEQELSGLDRRETDGRGRMAGIQADITAAEDRAAALRQEMRDKLAGQTDLTEQTNQLAQAVSDKKADQAALSAEKDSVLRSVEDLRDILKSKLEVGDSALVLEGKPAVVLVIGVNGVGKTTSIGKLAKQLKDQGKKVLLCAGDTFRAAAADQLEIWAGRAGVDIVRQHEGADPGAVLFDALQAAKARSVDVVLCDTAGRLHNKQNLMNELAKLRKIIDRECPNSNCETLLVLDATTGQNGLIQARTFKETAGLTGIILTKLDGTAKGGIVIAIAQELGVPVKFVGVGEGIDDLKPFDPTAFVRDMI